MIRLDFRSICATLSGNERRLFSRASLPKKIHKTGVLFCRHIAIFRAPGAWIRVHEVDEAHIPSCLSPFYKFIFVQ